MVKSRTHQLLSSAVAGVTSAAALLSLVAEGVVAQEFL